MEAYCKSIISLYFIAVQYEIISLAYVEGVEI